MNFFVANIDEQNFDMFNKASESTGIKYEKGAKMTVKSNKHEQFSFYPVFCNSISDGVTLISDYTRLKNKITDCSHDQILHQILIELLIEKNSRNK